jgi:2-oxoglutarate ferredoxin oxidoreductase subunit alpha
VIVLLDNFMATSLRTVERAHLRFDRVVVDRGELLAEHELNEMSEEYRRYALTDSGISPRALPGHSAAVFVACSDEHDEFGNFADEDPDNRVRMVKKRQRKLTHAQQEMGAPFYYGPPDAEIVFVGWGSTYGAIRETVDRMNEHGPTAALLHYCDIWPLSEKGIKSLVDLTGHLVAVENNSGADFARFLRTFSGVHIQDRILRFDGRPLTPDYIMDRLP